MQSLWRRMPKYFGKCIGDERERDRMKKRTGIIMLLLLILVGSGIGFFYKKQHRYDGIYTAVDPPEESGEMVIESLSFKGDQVTLISGNTQQTVKYEMKDGQFWLITKFGSFSYKVQVGEDELILDGVTYRK